MDIDINERFQPLQAQRMKQLKSAPIEDGKTLSLPLVDIEAYSGNPRLYVNPKYAEIKESIRRIGVQHRIIVTRRPNQEKYVIRQGGNTRLQCLRELYEETGDARFASAPCIYKHWTEEIDLLLGHMVENDHRGNLNWHERAHMICELKKVLEQSQNRQLSSRQFKKEAAQHGITVYQEKLHLQQYTLKRLAGPFASALAMGMGRTKVMQLHRAEQALRKLWNESSLPDDHFDAMISHQFKAMEGTPDLYQLAEKVGWRFHSQVEEFHIDEFSQVLLEYVNGQTRQMPKFTEFLYSLNPAEETFGESNDLPADWTEKEDKNEPDQSGDFIETERPADAKSESEQESGPQLYPSVLRKRIIEAREKIHGRAHAVAKWADCGDCVTQINYGYGFLVLHLPKRLESWQTASQQHRDQTWWLLFELSLTHVAIQTIPEETLLLARAENSDLLPFFESGSLDDLFDLTKSAEVETPSPLNTVRGMLLIPEKYLIRNWNHFLSYYRRLQHLSDREKYNIWTKEE